MANKYLTRITENIRNLKRAEAEAEVYRDAWLKAAQTSADQAKATADAMLQQTKQEVERLFQQVKTRSEQELAGARAANQQRKDKALAEARNTYLSSLSKVKDAQDWTWSESAILGADWTDERWLGWQPGKDQTHSSLSLAASGIRIGRLRDLGSWDELHLPALIPLIGHRSLLFNTNSLSRSTAIHAVQSLLLRVLAAIPPGKLRFIFIDPVGLGQNVAPFMHLADYDDMMVTSRAWTEPNHIEQRLADLTEHMETVIQKYLRNQYANIEEYNQKAGEVAEPYRVLVVNDFPANFSDQAARRLVSIVQNGPRCGVYTVVLVDTGKPLPYGFNLADLEHSSTVISWDEKRFVWQDDDFRDCQLELDSPPSNDLIERIIKSVGEAAKKASRVEVPFERIVLSADQFWTASTLDRLSVPLGPAGARKLQYLTLGQGTAIHALVAGKTGSGKSRLLHALITNLSLSYSPEEVELYLIDFKKGVEFKIYATYALPHARVIAIESEREFGLSVLQGLDAELKRRGDLFRAAGVDALSAYRKLTQSGGQPMPRTMLIVDEFQEFFTEDDSIARQAGQLLDRLVRQGRAFGMHVLLGSQTLAGAYNLARSTIEQMAVRIALQCSESDSRLILADDNGAARLLSRPGEAIYNDANGRVEGNSPFQVAWLSDEQHKHYLTQIHSLAQQNGYRPHRPQIVFEGNAPASVEGNQILTDLLAAPQWPQTARRVVAWLGEPIAIADPTAAYFRRQTGSNLLMVGQSDEAALATLSTTLISLAAQHAPGAARFYLLDFSSTDADYAGVLEGIGQRLPHVVCWGRRRELPTIISEIADVVNARLGRDYKELTEQPAIYLFIYGLQRARDLRADDMMSYSYAPIGDEEAPPNPAQQFLTILQEGPDMGVHTIVWCDTMTNLNRTIDHRGLREFEMRVAFQMSTEDSKTLIDSSAASQLGPYRAIFVSEEEARTEKFRPYHLPGTGWLEHVFGSLSARNGTNIHS